MKHPIGIQNGTRHLAIPAALLAALTALPSCDYDHYYAGSQDGGGIGVELSIMTRAIISNSQTYEVGTKWENYIDIIGGDYKIYFFTNDKDDATATDDSGRNTLITEFVPKEVSAIDETDYTQYTLSGKVGDDIAAYSDFKVVVLANWGNYPEVTAGSTTIDDLVESEDATFSAATFFSGVDESHLIPFYGVREYSGVVWKEGWRTTLAGDISLLRALAKVEVVLSEDSGIDSFDSVSIVRYNESGCCAPKGVYLRGDYDHGYDWDEDFTEEIHLVGGENADAGTALFNHLSDTDTDTWTIYLPEYDNTSNSDDYSFIRVTIDGIDYEIYFSNYTDGSPSSTADYDICRNYLYRFVTDLEDVVAEVESWEFSMEVKQYAASIDADYVNTYFTDYYYEQDDDAMTIEFPINDIVAMFVMIPTLLYNGRDITAEAEWTCVCTSSEQTSVIVTKSPTVSDGLVEVHVTDLTATIGYTYKLTLTATWTGDGGGEMGITYDITTTMGSYRPRYNQLDIYVYPEG